MQDADFEDYIQNRYEREIAWYDRRAQQNQWLHRGLQLYAIAASVTIPVLLSVEDLPEVAIGALAASVAAAGGIMALLKPNENWLNYRATAETLRKELHLYRAAAGEYEKAPDRKKVFVERVEALISREHTVWLATAARREER